MPRIYSDNFQHSFNQGVVEFTEGVAAVAADAKTGWFAANSYAVDASKHALTEFDKLDVPALQAICDQMVVSHNVLTDTKQSLVRAIETEISTNNLAALTVTSAAGTESGDSLITVTAGAVGTAGNTFAYKTHATEAPAILYGDVPADWTAIASGTDITATTGHKITVAELTAAGAVVAAGNATITSKA